MSPSVCFAGDKVLVNLTVSRAKADPSIQIPLEAALNIEVTVATSYGMSGESCHYHAAIRLGFYEPPVLGLSVIIESLRSYGFEPKLIDQSAFERLRIGG